MSRSQHDQDLEKLNLIFRPHSLRARLVVLVVTVALPLVAFALMQALRDAQHQRRNIETGLMSTARSIAVGVEQELRGGLAALTALAATRELEAHDLEAFYDEARHVRDVQPWYSVWLVDREGRQVLNLLRPFGSDLPALGHLAYVRQAWASGEATVSGLLHDELTSEPHVAITVPVVQQGRTRYVLVAGMRPTAFSTLAWASDGDRVADMVSIVDRDARVLLRNPGGMRWTGQMATAPYRQAIAQAYEGVARLLTLEGELGYVAFQRLEIGHWTVGVGTPASAVDGPFMRHVAFTAAVGLAMLLMAVGTALLLGRRLARPIEQLAQSARDIAEDRVPAVVVDTPLTELLDLQVALRRAGDAIEQRHRMLERERLFALELAAAEDRERQQIAHDLHDELGQTLAAMQIRLAALCRHADPCVDQAAGELLDLCRRADRSTRSLSEQIAPPVLYDLGLLPALEWLAEDMQRQFGLDMRVRTDGAPMPLLAEVRSIVYRAVRELVINVAKHARCDAAQVELRSDGQSLCVAVRDRGQGFAMAPAAAEAAGRRDGGGMGLRSVCERLLRIGGTFSIHSHPGLGTEALLRVPLARADTRETVS